MARPRKKRLVVGLSGATGAVYAVRLLEALRDQAGWESHLVVSEAGLLNGWHELRMKRRELEALADFAYNARDIGAAIASGSFLSEGMVIAPCSMKTLAAVAHGYANNLLTRAADVALKERRRVVLMVRETPLNLAHIRNMATVTEMGAIVFPPVPAFYSAGKSLDDAVAHSVGRVLDLFGVDTGKVRRWAGLKNGPDRPGP